MHSIRWSFLALALPAAVYAQAAPAAPARPEFEVASVKAVSNLTAGPTVNIGIRIDGAQFSCTSYSLRDYIRFAYNVKAYQVVGPEWMEQERFEITAKMPETSARDQVREMLQTLLEERFKLKLHREKRDLPVYALVVGKSGIKMELADANGAPPAGGGIPNVNVTASGGPGGVGVDLGHGSSFHFGNDKFEATKLPMATFADSISIFVDRPVVDMTELKGTYNFVLNFTEEDYRAMLIRSAINNGVNLPPQVLQVLQQSSGDSLFAAVQLLGLKLEPRKAPLDVMVIDSAEKTPTAN